jgi:hypothetical protein
MLTDLDWKGFEGLVHAIERNRHPEDVVTLDAKLRDIVTGHQRQVDILVERGAGGPERRFVIECKHYKTRRVTQPDVEQFVSFLKSVNATGGALVASGGYSEAAKLYANAMDIGLFALSEATDLEWDAYLEHASKQKIKKRLISSDLTLFTDRGTVAVGQTMLSSATTELQLFGCFEGDFIPVSRLRQRDPSIASNFFLFMPTLPGFAMQWIESQVDDKLWGSKQSEYLAMAATQVSRRGARLVALSLISFTTLHN